MWTIFREGGFPMWFVLFFGLSGLVTAFVYAVRPDAKREGFIRWMIAATIFATLSGTFAAMGQVLHYVSNHALAGQELASTLCLGFGESMSAGIMGFAFVGLTAMMCAVGKRRLDARASA
jgi:hypothetical protein